jgi:hypothetical protein
MLRRPDVLGVLRASELLATEPPEVTHWLAVPPEVSAEQLQLRWCIEGGGRGRPSADVAARAYSVTPITSR